MFCDDSTIFLNLGGSLCCFQARMTVTSGVHSANTLRPSSRHYYRDRPVPVRSRRAHHLEIVASLLALARRIDCAVLYLSLQWRFAECLVISMRTFIVQLANGKADPT